MPKTQLSIWSDIENKWIQEHFNGFLKKHKLKTSCSSCYSIHFTAVFSFDSLGKTNVSITKEYVCGKKFTKKQKDEITNLLKKIVFPSEFWGNIYRFRIGRTLKC